MNRRYLQRKDGPAAQHFSVLLFLSICFGLGLILGCALAFYLEVKTDTQLLAYLNDYFSLAQENRAEFPSLISVFWEVFRWPLIAGLLGLTLLGLIAVPLTFLARGFLLSYAISVFVRLYGISGLPLAASVFGLSALLSVTALFWVGVDAFVCGRTLNGAGKKEQKERLQSQKSLIVHTVGTLCWIAVGTAVQYWLSPILLRNVTALFL